MKEKQQPVDPKRWRKPVWSLQQCRQLIAKYPDDMELWRRAVAALDEQGKQGATGTWIAVCFATLETAWDEEKAAKKKKEDFQDAVRECYS